MSGRIAQRLMQPASLRSLALGVAAVVAVSLGFTAPDLLKSAEERSGDPLWQMAAGHPGAAERRVVLVDIDESSLARVGAWPWPRERVAELSAALAQQGARVQLMDIAFPEARDGDKALAQAQAGNPLHVGQIFALNPDASRVGQLSGALSGLSCTGASPFPVAGGYVANTAQLATGAGHITPTLDADGGVRRIAPVICHQSRAYPALALLGLGNQDAPALRYEGGQGWLGPHGWLRMPELGLSVPLDADGTTRLGYTLPRAALTAVSAADVLDGRVPPDLLGGAIALVGATAFGLGDTVTTPLAANAAGVEVHAQFIAGLLDGRLPYTPRAAWALQLAFAVLAGGALMLLVAHGGQKRRYMLPLFGIGIAASAYGLHAALLLTSGLWVGWLFPALFAALAGIALASVEFVLARLERERLYRNLSSYLPEQVAAQIALREPVGTIEAERREISVLFADLRNFSAYCEARPPEEAAALLHAFFSTAQRVVRAHGGIIEEFVGDAIMAIWNAPESCSQHPERALQAAQELVREVTALLPAEAPPGLEPLALGVGLETGKALVGSFGTAERRTHTALGETVTVAVRLQGMSVELASPIVVGPGAAAQLPEAGLIGVGSFLLEGLQRPRNLFLPALAPAGDEQHPHIRLVASA
ncbi:CHASE2 domain-containing protein [Zoogloea sp. LCSB751]|uniref:CHASE2 domain-containing protein n=1 Tax=Zoogloea sp. LCSB751 TaxID=1965277 RepID=UPI0009A48E64|nr:adenylate/guanylate cyclase domain-containing protein [Zoogloea sp. LCSB751]